MICKKNNSSSYFKNIFAKISHHTDSFYRGCGAGNTTDRKIACFFPDAQIDFLLRKGNEQLLAGHPHIHKILIWDKKNHKQKNLFRLIKHIRKNKYDNVINVQRFLATGLLTIFSGAKVTIGFDKNPLSLFFYKKNKTCGRR